MKFWKKHQRYQTICLPCISQQKIKNTFFESNDHALTNCNKLNNDYPNWKGFRLDDQSTSILMLWYKKARENMFENAHDNKPKKIEISDDDDVGSVCNDWMREEIFILPESQNIAIAWLRNARTNLQREQGWDGLRMVGNAKNLRALHPP